jgi:hypothetical protein
LLDHSWRLPDHIEGLDVISTKRFASTLAAAIAAVALSPMPGDAQIVFPIPPYRNLAYDSSVRLEVTPRDAEVYVDGYYAGVVDDFDGVLQRLRVEPGQHELALYHEGYRTTRQRVYLVRDKTFKMKVRMEPLPPGEAAEPRPVAAVAPTRIEPPRPLPRNGRQGPPPNPPTAVPAPAATGRLTIRVEPRDATLTIDGQPWPAASDQDGFILDVPEGRHVIQVRKSGYVGYLTEVDVRGGETTGVDVSLRPQP